MLAAAMGSGGDGARLAGYIANDGMGRMIRSDTRYLEKGWPLWKRPVFPIHVLIEVGEALVPAQDEESQTFTARLQAVFEQELAKPQLLRRQ